jgi:hypothetical protein
VLGEKSEPKEALNDTLSPVLLCIEFDVELDMSRTFSAYCGLIALFLGSCGLLVSVTNCAGMIRTSIVSILMSAIAWSYLKQANEIPIGFWLNLYRSGLVVAIAIISFAITRIVSSLQGVGCQY